MSGRLDMLFEDRLTPASVSLEQGIEKSGDADHAMSIEILSDSRSTWIVVCNNAYAIMLTLRPGAALRIYSPSFSALASMEPEGGTAAVKHSMPLALSASMMPRQ